MTSRAAGVVLLCSDTRGQRELVSWEDFDRAAPAADFRLQYGPESLMFGELRLPRVSARHPVFMVIHGGCWSAEFDLLHLSHLSEALRRLGFAVWTPEYRRVGNVGGGWPGTFQDVAAAANKLAAIANDFQLDLNRAFVLGHSAGGHLALWLAAHAGAPEGFPEAPPLRVHPRAVFALAAISDLRTFGEGEGDCNRAVRALLGGTPDEVPDRYAVASPLERPNLGVPAVLIHGGLDTIVPLSQSESYVSVAELANPGTRLHVLEAAGHFDLIAPFSPVWSAVQAWILSAVEELD